MSNRMIAVTRADRLDRKPQIEPLLMSLNSLLSSSRPNESISEELAELIGFEEIELAMDILNQRDSLCHEVTSCIWLLWDPMFIVTDIAIPGR